MLQPQLITTSSIRGPERPDALLFSRLLGEVGRAAILSAERVCCRRGRALPTVEGAIGNVVGHAHVYVRVTCPSDEYSASAG